MITPDKMSLSVNQRYLFIIVFVNLEMIVA